MKKKLSCIFGSTIVLIILGITVIATTIVSTVLPNIVPVEVFYIPLIVFVIYFLFFKSFEENLNGKKKLENSKNN